MSLWKKLLIILLGILALIFSALYIVSLKYEKIVSRIIVEQLNSVLDTEIAVGEVGVSPWAELPYISLQFKDVLIEDPLNSKDTLLQAERLFFHFNVLDLLREDYRIKKIAIESAKVNIKKAKNGLYNYKIWKATADTNTSFLELNSVKISNSRINYLDQSGGADLAYECESVSLKFSALEDELLLDLYGKLKSLHSYFGKTDFLPSKNLKLDLGMRVITSSANIYSFHRARVEINKQVELDIEGQLSENSIKLSLRSDAVEVENLIANIPLQFVKSFAEYNPRGKASVHLQLEENDLSKRRPALMLQSELSDVKISLSKQKKTIVIPRMKAVFSNGDQRSMQSSVLTLDSAIISSDNSNLEMSLDLVNFNSPQVRIKASGKIGLAEWLSTKDSRFAISEGQFDGKLSLQFSYRDSLSIESFSAQSNRIEGQISGLKGNFDKNQFGIESCELELQRGHLLVSDALIQINDDALNLNFLFQNFGSMFLEQKDEMMISAELSGSKLNLDEFFESLQDSEENQESVAFPKVNMDFRLDELRYLENTFEKCSGNLSYINNRLVIKQAKFDHSKGEIEAEFSIAFNNNGSEFNIFGDFKKLDIKALFAQFNNFEQDVLKSENISGLCTGEANFYMQFDKEYHFDPKSLRAIVSLTLDNGALIDFEPMQAVADYFDSNMILRKLFKADELRKKLENIEFESLRNDFFIRDEEVYTPLMEIKSSVIDINLEGSYGFNNIVDYSMDFYITDLLARKNKASDFSEEVIDDGTGRKRVFLKMTGPVDNPNFEIDKEKRKEFRKGVVNSEKNTVKQVLKEELGVFNSDTTLKSVQEKPKEEDFELIWDPEEHSDSTTKKKENKKDTLSNSKMKNLLKKLIEEKPAEKSTDDFEWDDDY